MKIFILTFLIVITLSIGTVSFAAEAHVYTPLVHLPRVNGNLTTEGYVNALYFLSITAAALLAIVKIIFGGVQYMLTDVVTSKGEALKNIKGALLGLLIVLSAVLILDTINVNLKILSIFKENSPAIEKTLPITTPAMVVALGDTISLKYEQFSPEWWANPNGRSVLETLELTRDFAAACPGVTTKNWAPARGEYLRCDPIKRTVGGGF